MHDPVHHLWDVGAVAPALSAKSHRTSAIDANNSVWEILGDALENLSGPDAEEATRRAYAAAYHWQRADGAGPANAARADWLLAKVWIARGNAATALHHARRCLETCESEGLGDFDLAYAHEVMARAHACAGETDSARTHREKAHAVEVLDPEDRAIVEQDLVAGPWFGLA